MHLFRGLQSSPILGLVTILAPLVDVASRVVQAERIGRVGADRGMEGGAVVEPWHALENVPQSVLFRVLLVSAGCRRSLQGFN